MMLNVVGGISKPMMKDQKILNLIPNPMTHFTDRFVEARIEEFRKAVKVQYNNGDPYWPDWSGVEKAFRSSLLDFAKEIRREVREADVASDKVGSFRDGYLCLREQVLALLQEEAKNT